MKGTALKALRPKYRRETDIRPLRNESEEHYLMRMLTFATICNDEGVEPEAPPDKKWEEDERDEGATIKIEYPKDGPKRADLIAEHKGRRIWAEVETCKALEDPLENVYQKMERIRDVGGNLLPTELWLVLPYRKFWIYGREELELRLRNRLKQLLEDKGIEVRIFLADLYRESLREVSQPSKE